MKYLERILPALILLAFALLIISGMIATGGILG